MNYKVSGANGGCLFLFILGIILVLLFRFTWMILFKTPLGIALLIYIIYKYFKFSKKVKQQKTERYEQKDEGLKEEIEVDYEEYD